MHRKLICCANILPSNAAHEEVGGTHNVYRIRHCSLRCGTPWGDLQMKQLVLGILAHVDSGKTTLSEGMLYQSGSLKRLGRVDKGDAFLDTYALERERGITIFSKQAVLSLDDTEFTLLDTPGHVDFSPEMERTLQVLDCAILVISGTDGIQSHTLTLWRLLARHNVPTFLFINKMDLPGASRAARIAELRGRMGDGCIDFNEERSVIDEQAAMCDDELLTEYLESGSLSDDSIRSAIGQRKIFPCFFGSALKLQGVDDFLLGLRHFAPVPARGEAFGARVFKIARDAQGNRLTYLKVTGGCLRVKDSLSGGSGDHSWNEKINQLRIYSGAKFRTVEEAPAGTVCAVLGLSKTRPGEGLGAEPDPESTVLEPVLTYRLIPPPDVDAHTALGRLRIIEEEEPQLHVVWNEQLQEIHVQLMGEVQLEVLSSLLEERFQMSVQFGQGNIVYKETITEAVEGVGHFEPLRHYAEVHLLLEPGEPGSGLSFESVCSLDRLDRNWQRLILTHLEEKTHLGVLTGSPITDMKITLLSGRAHQKHTEGGDFRQATYRAVRQGLRRTKSTLLEPWYDVRFEMPSEFVGRAMADLQRMNGRFDSPQITGDSVVLTGSVPVATMRNYQTEFTAYTRGLGRLICTLRGYEPCHNAQEVIDSIAYDCDADVENTADSVFCSHGAGFTVRWDRAEEYMHLECGWRPQQENAKSEEPAVSDESDYVYRHAAAYQATLEEDKELMAIFERTYGPIRRDPRAAMRTEREHVSQYRSPGRSPAPQNGPSYLLIDGYNVIFAWDDLKETAREDLDMARHQLMDRICNYRGFCDSEVILVFDAYRVKGNTGEVERYHNISVVYTKEAETADMYIEKVTHELSRHHQVRVVTSDGLEQLIILSHGALRVSASAFLSEVEQVERSVRSYLGK